MQTKKESSVNLLTGKIVFNGSEPMWVRILTIIIVAAFLLLVLHYAAGWSLPTIAGAKNTATKIYKAIRGGSP